MTKAAPQCRDESRQAGETPAVGHRHNIAAGVYAAMTGVAQILPTARAGAYQSLSQAAIAAGLQVLTEWEDSAAGNPAELVALIYSAMEPFNSKRHSTMKRARSS